MQFSVAVQGKPEKIADVSRGRLLSPRKTTSEKRVQKFHTDDVHHPDLGSASDWLKENSLAAQPIRSTTKVWVRYSDVVLRRLKWRPRETLAVLSGYSRAISGPVWGDSHTTPAAS